jgi:hypothetical protein
MLDQINGIVHFIVTTLIVLLFLVGIGLWNARVNHHKTMERLDALEAQKRTGA